MYMVIHDLKHPTESLMSSVEQILKKFDDFKSELKILQNLCKCSDAAPVISPDMEKDIAHPEPLIQA